MKLDRHLLIAAICLAACGLLPTAMAEARSLSVVQAKRAIAPHVAHRARLESAASWSFRHCSRLTSRSVYCRIRFLDGINEWGDYSEAEWYYTATRPAHGRIRVCQAYNDGECF